MARKVGTITAGAADNPDQIDPPRGAATAAQTRPARTLAPSEEIKARYDRIERQADKFGRVIGVRRLRPSVQARIHGMLADLGQDQESFGTMALAACVCEIDGAPYTPPKTRAELDAVADMLDGEGLMAAAIALAALQGVTLDMPQEGVALAAKK